MEYSFYIWNHLKSILNLQQVNQKNREYEEQVTTHMQKYVVNLITG